MKVLLIIAALFTGFAAFAEECTLDASELKSAVNLKPKYLSASTAVDTSEGQFISQTVVLLNGQEVIYRAGGCEHYSYSFTYVDALPASQKATGEEVLALALELISSTPTTKSGKSEKNTLINAIKNADKDFISEEGAIPLACGDATCDVYRDGSDIIIGYMFAL